jgi:hypothetical protein
MHYVGSAPIFARPRVAAVFRSRRSTCESWPGEIPVIFVLEPPQEDVARDKRAYDVETLAQSMV